MQTSFTLAQLANADTRESEKILPLRPLNLSSNYQHIDGVLGR